MKKIITLFFIMYAINLNCQNKEKKSNQKINVPLDYFKKYYSKTDSLGFFIRDKNTFIIVEEFIKPNGLGVPYEPKDSIFLEIYKTVAFRPKKKKSTDTQPMKYWKKDIKIFFTKNISKKVKRELFSFINKIDNKIDSLNIIKSKSFEEANYIIYNNQDLDYEVNLKNTKTAGYYVYWNKKNQITKGFIKINNEYLFSDLLQIQKVKQSFIFSLGFFNPNRELQCSSYFSNCFSDKKQFSKLDYEILKYHYSYGICKGTTLSVFEKQHELAKKSIKTSRDEFIFYH